MPEAEVKTVTGICGEIAQKPGSDWVEFHVDSGGKWPVKMSTKLQPLIELGRAAGKELATWTYKEVDSGTPNPHNPGSNFLNRYLEKVEVGGAQNGPDATVSPSSATPSGTNDFSVQGPQRPPVLGGDKDRLIVRQTCIKAAAELIAGRSERLGELDDIALEVMKAAQRFESWVYRDLEPPPFV